MNLGQNISAFWNNIQNELFPLIEEKVGSLLESHMKVVANLELLRIESLVPTKDPFQRGAPRKNWTAVARAFIAKHTLGLERTSDLIDRLNYDVTLKRICGWGPGEKVPKKYHFSRVFKELADLQIFEKAHERVVCKSLKGELVINSGRDSLPIIARERVQKEKPQTQYTKKDTRLKAQANGDMTLEEMIEDLPKACNNGTKTNSCGSKMHWKGYKLHLDVAEGYIPISCLVTSASTHDTQPAIPLSLLSEQRTNVLYELMDAGYVGQVIPDFISRRGRKPLIVPSPSSKRLREQYKLEKLARKNLNFYPPDVRRLKKRLAYERPFARLKDFFGLRQVWVRGFSKVRATVNLAVLCLTADELLRLYT